MVDTTGLTELISALRAETETDSISPERVGYVLQQIVDKLPSASMQLNAIKGYVVISSTSDLPTSPTTEQQMKGYLLGTTLYVWVGTGGDTLDGKYQSAQLKGADGKDGGPGPKGDSGVDLGEVVLVNDLTTGGEVNALSAEMGKTLAGMIPTVVNDLTTGGTTSALSAEQGKTLNGKLYQDKSLASGEVAVNTVLFTKADLAGSNKVAYDFSATSGKAGYLLLYKEGATSYYQRIGKTSGASGALDYSGSIDIPSDFDRAVWGGSASGTFRTLSCTVLKDNLILAIVEEMVERLDNELEETVSLPAGYYSRQELLIVGLDIAVGDILNYDFEVETGTVGVLRFFASDGTYVQSIGKTSSSSGALAYSGSVAVPSNTATIMAENITINSLTYTKKRIYELEQYQAINNAKYVPFANKAVCDNNDINKVLTGLYITNKDIISDLSNVTNIEIFGGTGASGNARPKVGIKLKAGATEYNCFYENDDASVIVPRMKHVFYCNGVFAVIDWSNLAKWSTTSALRYISGALTLNSSVVTDISSNPEIESYIGRMKLNRDYKLLALAGDSITFGLKDEGDGGGQWLAFPQVVAEMLQIKTINYGVASASVMPPPPGAAAPRTWSTEYNVISTDCDIIGMMIGINDAQRGYTLGAMSDRTTATFYGALHVMWQGLLDRFKPKDNKRLFMIDYFEIDIPIASTTWDSFVQAQREVAEYYSIPICYLSKELGITPQMDTNYEYWGEWTPAGTHSPHPKQPAHDAIARVVASWIKAHFG